MKNQEKTPKQTYNHLTFEERKHIEYLKNTLDKSARCIAEEMNRSPNTIANEINDGTILGEYYAEIGQKKADFKRRRSKTKLLKILLDGELRKKIEPEIRNHISPRRISGNLKDNENIIISDKAIYKFVHAYNLDSYLCFKGKPRVKKGQYNYRKEKELDKTRIDQRPDISNQYGHYEMDFIVSSKSTYSLLVLVEILTKALYVRKIPNRKHETVSRALKSIFHSKTPLSITTDNDIAFSNWKQLELKLKTKIYFCYPYHSWEKGLIENSNRWIRQFVKKKSDIQFVTEETLLKIDYWFNQYPREVIGFNTANELVLKHSSVLLVG